MRNFSEVHKGQLMKRYGELSRKQITRINATLAKEFNCDRLMVEQYIRTRLSAMERHNRQPSPEELMEQNGRIEVRHSPYRVTYVDDTPENRAWAERLHEAMG